ncbi:MAG: glycosyltransferase [Verrucomicrobiae bacterium]|nr:glycosyltransferase [Verrucomicrobiae bacterium]
MSRDRLKILWLKTGALHPLDTGGKLRTYNMLRQLNTRHEVCFLAFLPPGIAKNSIKQASEYSSEQLWIEMQETPKGSLKFCFELFLNLFSDLPYVIEKYKSAKMSAKIAEVEETFDITICDFLTPAVNWLSATKRPTKSLLFQHNVEALIWKRLAETAGNPIKKWYFTLQWKRLKDFEQMAAAHFGGVVCVSDEDCRLMHKDYGLTNILGSVPTGVDVDYFKPIKRAPEDGLIVFVGSMDWMPNIDAVHYFVNEIYPKIKKTRPGTRFAIVGRKPMESVRALARKDNSIIVTGTVDDVRPWLDKATAMVVPLRAGGGTRIKIYEAMAQGTPVVSTSIGAEGLAIKDNENILIADSVEEFAQDVLTLLEDRTLGEKISKNARELVEKNFSWQKVATIFENYCYQIVEQKPNNR